MARTRGAHVALLAATVLAVAACGGGDSDSATSDTTAGNGSSVIPSPDIEVGGGFDGSVQDCQELVSAFSVLALGPYTGLFGGEQEATEAEDVFADINARVPAELTDEFETIEAAYAKFEEALGGDSIAAAASDPALAARLQEAAAEFDSPNVQEAIDTVGTFLEDNCQQFNITP